MSRVPIGCVARGCALYAVERGRCEVHQMTERQRGYGADWRETRAKVRRQVRACQECGAMSDLTVDHITPQSMGGTNARTNLRVLCRRCHSRIGRRWVSA